VLSDPEGLAFFRRHASFRFAWPGHCRHPATFAVEFSLFALAWLLLVISDTAPGRLLLAVSFPATERTAQNLALGATRMGDEENPAMMAAHSAAPLLRSLSENQA
jgi:hypothetical protein